MEVVTENSEADIAQRRAMNRVAHSLRALAANLIRVTRGAGRPGAIGQQAAELLHAMQDHWNAVGCYPSGDELAAALDIAPPQEILDSFNDEYYQAEHAKLQVVRGALQIAASRLLHQRTQECAGESELSEGTRGLARVAEARQKRRAEEGGTPRGRRPRAAR